MTQNREGKKAIASLIFAVIFGGTCLLALTTLDGINGGYALAVISFFPAVSGIAVAGLFFHRAQVMDAILYDPAPLAHWTYPLEMVQKNVDREYQDF